MPSWKDPADALLRNGWAAGGERDHRGHRRQDRRTGDRPAGPVRRRHDAEEDRPRGYPALVGRRCLRCRRRHRLRRREAHRDTPDLVGLCGKDHRALGKRLLDTNGDELGRVDDVEFDPRSGDVTALVLADGRVPGTRLVGIGSYAVVVQHD
ncbi:PRC-barrel domain-containing protein [Tsukamurella soli]|uniref:PRC-barrel domain-containing protein n=1 Tax=Tsukamurella soli TaxID=644556 RepID=UPI00360E3081